MPVLDDSSEYSLALSCQIAMDVFTVMQHGAVSGALVDVEAVLSPDVRLTWLDDKVTTQVCRSFWSL